MLYSLLKCYVIDTNISVLHLKWYQSYPVTKTNSDALRWKNIIFINQCTNKYGLPAATHTYGNHCRTQCARLAVVLMYCRGRKSSCFADWHFLCRIGRMMSAASNRSSATTATPSLWSSSETMTLASTTSEFWEACPTLGYQKYSPSWSWSGAHRCFVVTSTE